MEPCQITQTHRPPRLGFVIPYDKDKIIEFIKYTSASAGGIYNFIFPYKDDADFKKWEKYRRPGLQDYIFHDEGIPEAPKIQWREWPDFDKRFVLKYDDYPESYLSFIDVAPFHQEWQFLPGRQSEKSELVCLKSIESSTLFPLFLFGDLPNNLSFQFKESWKQLGASEYDFNWADYLNPFGKPKRIGPLQFTRMFLHVRGNLDPEGIFYIADPKNLDDLLEFWNLRALGHRIIFLPENFIDEPFIDYKKWDETLTPRYKYTKPEMIDWYRPNVIFGSAFHGNEQKQKGTIEKLKKQLTSIHLTEPVFHYNPHDLYPRAKFVYFREDRYPAYDASAEIRTVTKSPFSNSDIPHNQKWLVNYSTNFLNRESHPSHLPELSIESEKNLFQKTYYRAEHIHISRGGLSVVGQFDNFEVHVPKVTVLQIVSAVAETKKYEVDLSKPGQNVTLILKGLGNLAYDARILKIKGVRDVIRAANRDSLVESDLDEILKDDPPDSTRMINEGKLSRESLRGYLKKILSRYHEKIINEEFTGIKRDKALDLIKNGMEDTKEICIAPYKKADSQKFILEKMLEQNLLELGFNFECGKKHTCWYPINKLSESIECRICGDSKKVIDPQNAIQWSYQTKGMFRLKNDAEGSLSVIVALWQLMHSLHNASFTPNIDVKRKQSGNDSFEIDYAILLENWDQHEPNLIIGEAKSLNSLDQDDMGSMSKALEVFSELRPAACFSTLKDQFSDEEKELIKAFRKEHPYIEIFTFVRKQLEVYDLHECGIREYGLKRIAPELYQANIGDKYWLDPREIRSQ